MCLKWTTYEKEHGSTFTQSTATAKKSDQENDGSNSYEHINCMVKIRVRAFKIDYFNVVAEIIIYKGPDSNSQHSTAT